MPAVDTPVAPIAETPAAPVGLPGGGWALPQSVLAASERQFQPRPQDTSCLSCGSALFFPQRVVRMRQGYPDGSRTNVTLFVCVRCGSVLNPQELAEVR